MRRFEPVAGLGGLLLAVSLFLPWYRDTTVVFQDNLAEPILAVSLGGSEVTAWEAFSVVDILLALVAALAIAVPIVSVATSGPAKAIGLEVITSVTGLLGVLLVAFRLVDAPFDGVELRTGAWLALAGALIAWAGSWMSMRDESTPGATPPDVPRRPVPG
jgi:hypothetical protein